MGSFEIIVVIVNIIAIAKGSLYVGDKYGELKTELIHIKEKLNNCKCETCNNFERL